MRNIYESVFYMCVLLADIKDNSQLFKKTHIFESNISGVLEFGVLEVNHLSLKARTPRPYQK